MTNEIKEIYEQSLERMENADFSTGFDDLDIFCKFLGGGDIMIIGGRPAMGKTNFAASLTNHLADSGKSVLYCSLGQSATQFIYRLVAEKMAVPLLALLEGMVRQEEVDKVLNSFEDKKLFVKDRLVNTEDVETAIKKVKPEVVFIDDIQLMEAPKAPNRTEAINLVIKELKRVAVENDVIMVLLSQLSRAVESRCDRRPLLSDLRNGSFLEELSDVILFLYREEYYNSEAEPHNEVIIAKNTAGQTGIITLDFQKGFFRNLKTENTF